MEGETLSHFRLDLGRYLEDVRDSLPPNVPRSARCSRPGWLVLDSNVEDFMHKCESHACHGALTDMALCCTGSGLI